jgi:outer membrane cobalamin receptor
VYLANLSTITGPIVGHYAVHNLPTNLKLHIKAFLTLYSCLLPGTVEVLAAPVCAEVTNTADTVIAEVIVLESRVKAFDYAPFSNSEQTLPGSVDELLRTQPGVSLAGQGGLLQGVTLRGVSRQRLHWRIEDIPIRSERHAGSSLSFLNPAYIDNMSIRSPANSQSLGAGSVGGALVAELQSADSWTANAGYDSIGRNRYLAVLGGFKNVHLGVSERSQDTDRDASGQLLNVAYRQRSAYLKTSYETSVGPTLNVFAYTASGSDIGKSNTDFPQRITTYPDDEHHMAEISANGDHWRSYIYAYNNMLSTQVVENGGRVQTRYASQDRGLGVERTWSTQDFATTVHAQWDYRGNVEISQLDSTSQLQPISGSEGLGLFGAEISKQGDHANYEASLFWHQNRQQNLGADHDDTIWTGALSARWGTASGDFSLELARNFRHPTLSERFYSGTTGRGNTLGNPRLKAELIDSLTGGYNYHTTRLNVSLEGFVASASDFIERQDLGADSSTSINQGRAYLYGVRWVTDYRFGDSLTIGTFGQHTSAKSDASEPLNNQGANEVGLLANYTFNRHEITAHYRRRLSDTSVSDQDRALDQANLIDVVWHLQASDQWQIKAGAYNLLNDTYRLATDRKATFGFGRSLRIQLQYLFA